MLTVGPGNGPMGLLLKLDCRLDSVDRRSVDRRFANEVESNDAAGIDENVPAQLIDIVRRALNFLTLQHQFYVMPPVSNA